MATHFIKFRGLKNNLRNPDLSKKYMEKMIVREPVDKTRNLHPSIKKRWEQMTQPPVPLTFKLHPMDLIREKQGVVSQPSEVAENAATYEIFE